MTATLTQTQTAIDSALAELKTRRTKFEALQRESNELFAIASPGRVNTPTASLATALRARARQAENNTELALAAADIEDAERLVADLRAIDRDARAAGIRERQKPIVVELAKALDKAAAVNAKLAAMDEESAANAGGTVVARSAWPELQPDSPVCQSRLDLWRATMRAEGLLD